MNKTVLTEIVSRIVAIRNCQQSGNEEWEAKHKVALRELQSDLPSGSGIDNGTQIDAEASTQQRLVLHTAFHHMNDAGMYDGWTEHTITVRPDLLFGFTLSISGRDRNDIKDYLNDVYTMALQEPYEPIKTV